MIHIYKLIALKYKLRIKIQKKIFVTAKLT